MIYVTLEQVLELHDALIDSFGGLKGLRDQGLLESALNAPRMAVFGQELYPSIYDKAAAYLFHIARNHAFLDGNKRTASSVALIFLRTNAQVPSYHVDEFLEFIVSVAEGKKTIPEISSYLEEICFSKQRLDLSK